MTDDYKARAGNVERLEEENRELLMRVRLLEHEKERQEAALAEQIELAILRDRGRRSDETRDER